MFMIFHHARIAKKTYFLLKFFRPHFYLRLYRQEMIYILKGNKL